MNIQDLKVHIIQSDLHWEDIPQNLKMFESKINEIDKTDLIVLPEMFTTGFTNNSSANAEKMDGRTIVWMKEQASRKNCTICGSAIINDNNQIYNRFLWINEQGEITFYDKKHLFAMAGEHKYYSPGTSKKVIELHGWKILPLVCYDLRFPVWSRRVENENENYDLLVYVASWPVARINAWSTLLRARAVENMAYCIGVNRIGQDGMDINYSGESAIIDPLGRDLISSETNKNQILRSTLSYDQLLKYRKKLPFQKDADSFVLKANTFV